MSKYWCKCGRVVNKSTNASTTGNRDTESCAGCPYLLPYGPNVFAQGGYKKDVQGYECRMTDHPVDYTTHISSLGGPNDKTVLHVESLDFDFLDAITEWVNDTFTEGELAGGFKRNTLRASEFMDGYRVTFYPSQNKKGVAAKQQLFHRFFHPDGTRIDMTPEEEKAKVLADIEKSKEKKHRQSEGDCPFYAQRDYGDYQGGHFCHLCGSLKCKHRTCSAKYKDDWHECDVFKRYGGERRLAEMKREAKGEKMEKVYKDAKGILYKVGETGEIGNADRTQLSILMLPTKPGATWRKKSLAPTFSLRCGKDAAQALDAMAEQNHWQLASEAEAQYNARGRAEQLDDLAEKTSTPLTVLSLSVRTMACLQRTSIRSVEELAGMSEEEIMRIRDMGRKGLEELTAELNRWRGAPEESQEVKTLQDLGLSDNCIRYLYDMGFENEDVDILDSLLPEEEERLQRDFPDNWNRIQEYLQSDGTDTNDGTTEESPQAENPTLADDLPWSAAATAAADQTAESPEPVALAPTTETAVSASESVDDVPTPVPALDGMPTFDYSGLDEQTVVDLHLAEREYTAGKKLTEMGLRRMADGVAIAHDALCGAVVQRLDNSKHGNRGEESFRAWCSSMGMSKSTAYSLLQVSDAFMHSSPNQQKVLEQLPVTLLYDYAKPSTTEEVKQDILSGDITTHKQYQEVMARNKQLEKDAELDRKERDDANAAAMRYKAEADRRAADQQRLEGLVATRERERDTAIQDAKRARKEQEESERLADDEIARVQRIADDATDRANTAEARVKELEGRPIEVTGADASDIARWRAEGAEQARQEIATQMAEMQEQVDDADAAQGNVVDALYIMAQQIAANCTAQLENWGKAAACLTQEAYMDCVQQLDPLRIQILQMMMEGADDEEMS